MGNWFTKGLNWVADRTPVVSNIKGAVQGNTAQAILGPGAHFKHDVTQLGQMTGLAPTPSEEEKKNLAEMRDFKMNMLAALQERMANGLPVPQLGAPSWMGYQTPTGQGTHLAQSPASVANATDQSISIPGASLIGGKRIVAATGHEVPPPSPAMAAEIERIKRQRLLQALGFGPGNGIRLG